MAACASPSGALTLQPLEEEAAESSVLSLLLHGLTVHGERLDDVFRKIPQLQREAAGAAKAAAAAAAAAHDEARVATALAREADQHLCVRVTTVDGRLDALDPRLERAEVAQKEAASTLEALRTTSQVLEQEVSTAASQLLAAVKAQNEMREQTELLRGLVAANAKSLRALQGGQMELQERLRQQAEAVQTELQLDRERRSEAEVRVDARFAAATRELESVAANQADTSA